MRQQIEEQVLRDNPHIDADKLRQAREELSRLQEQGAIRKSYGLQPPYGERRTAIWEDVRAAPRVSLGKLTSIALRDSGDW